MNSAPNLIENYKICKLNIKFQNLKINVPKKCLLNQRTFFASEQQSCRGKHGVYDYYY